MPLFIISQAQVYIPIADLLIPEGTTRYGWGVAPDIATAQGNK
jgi:hypothetical protein